MGRAACWCAAPLQRRTPPSLVAAQAPQAGCQASGQPCSQGPSQGLSGVVACSLLQPAAVGDPQLAVSALLAGRDARQAAAVKRARQRRTALAHTEQEQVDACGTAWSAQPDRPADLRLFLSVGLSSALLEREQENFAALHVVCTACHASWSVCHTCRWSFHQGTCWAGGPEHQACGERSLQGQVV